MLYIIYFQYKLYIHVLNRFERSEVLPQGQGYPFNYPFREAKVHLCICLAGAILSIIPFAKQTYTCVFVLRALSGPACIRFLKAVFKVILSEIF
jgi:hypothetical protein